MADLQYINPTALKPEIGWQPKGALGGYMWAQNNEDFRRSFEQQMRLQELGEQDRRIDLEQKQLDLPLKALQRQLQTNTTQGQIPFAGEVASTASQAGIAKNKYDIQEFQAPEKLKAAIAKHTKDFNDVQWEQFGRENQTAAGFLEQAMKIAEERGPAEAIGFMQQRRAEAKRAGINIPDSFDNPINWKPLYNSAMWSVKFKQEMEKEKLKAETDLERGRMSLEGVKYTADKGVERAGITGNKSPSMDDNKAIVALESQIAEARNSGDDATADQLLPQYLNTASRLAAKQYRELNTLGALNDKYKGKQDSFIKDTVRTQAERLGYKFGDSPKPIQDDKGRPPISSFGSLK